MKNQYKATATHRWVMGLNPQWTIDNSAKQYWIAVKARSTKQYQTLCEFDQQECATKYWDTIVIPIVT